MNKPFAAAVCLILLLLLSACGSKAVPETYRDTLAEAEKQIGFRLEAPESLNGSGTRTFRAAGRTLEIMYFDGKVVTGKISKSDNHENISGMFNEYSELATVNEYALYGNSETGLAYLAVWKSGKYSYLVMNSFGTDAAELTALCAGIR